MLVPITSQPGGLPPRPRRLATALRLRGRGALLVVANAEGYAMASCRLCAPDPARPAGRLEADAHFDLAALRDLRERMVEVTHARLAPGAGRAARDALWDAVSTYLLDRRLDYVLGTVLLPLPGPVEAHAAGLWRRLERMAASPENCRALPRRALPYSGEPYGVAPAPTWLDEWEGRGAWLCGDPAWTPRAGHAHVPFLLPLARMRAAALRDFLHRAA